MTVPVIWYTTKEDVDPWDQWDSGILKLMFGGQLWLTAHEFEHLNIRDDVLDRSNRTIVIVPARHFAEPDEVVDLNVYLSCFDAVLLILIGDEEAIFPWRDVMHPNIRFWVMMPDPVKHADMASFGFFIGNGFHEDTPGIICEITRSGRQPQRSMAWGFVGQNTHPRRKQAVNGLEKTRRRGLSGVTIPTEGFSQGLSREDYLTILMQSKTAPAPSGPFTPDTFRFYEALECGAIPIADFTTPTNQLDYWPFVYGDDFPFATVYDWGTVGGWIESEMAFFHRRQAEAVSWWIQQKRRMVKRLDSDLEALGMHPSVSRLTTVLVSSSPIPSHPSLAILEETLQSVWKSMDAEPEIILMLDGVRPEQEDMRAAYEEYLAEVSWRCLHQWRNVIPLISKDHKHQAAMTRWALNYVDTPTILFMEHDTPLVTDEPIDWRACLDLMAYGSLDVLRFHHEAGVHPEHERLMIDHETKDMLGVPVRRTKQFSARPHLARSDYYRNALNNLFSPGAKCFIEDRLHGFVQSYPRDHRVAIYHPAGKAGIKRSYTTDGRAGGPKYDDRQTW